MRTRLLSCCLVAGVALSACGEGFDDSRAGDVEPGDGIGATAGSGAFPGNGSGNGSAGTGGGQFLDGGVSELPPEVEERVDLLLPQASENFVYAANPTAGTVSVIYAKALTIRTLETGEQPTYLRTLAGTDDAIVLNVGSDTATVIRSTTAKSTTSDVDVVRGANAIGVATDGKHAVVYFNSTFASAGNGSGSFQDVSVLTLSEDGKDEAVSMTVGFRPRDVFFSKDSSQAYVVTEDGISVLDFAKIEKDGADIAPLFSFGGGVDQKTLDVAVTPDGRYALARAEGKSVLRFLDLKNGQVRTLDVADAYTPAPSSDEDDAGVPTTLPVEITDLDLAPDGSAAVAVLRNQAAVVTLPLPGVFETPALAKTQHITGEIIGSVTVSPKDGKTALLYTTAANVERITLLELGSDTPARTVLLRKAIAAVVFTPDGDAAFITHKKLEGSPLAPGLSADEKDDRSYGYSLLRPSIGFVKLQTTPTALGPLAIVPDGSFLFLLLRDDVAGIKEVHRVSLKSFQTEAIIGLESPPVSIGIAPASEKVFVNQDHPDGRMAFIDWKDPTMVKTVTGYELNSRIRD